MYSSMASSPWSPSPPPNRSRSKSPPPASPASPPRRLRGLSYLRTYTHTHLLSRESHSSSSSQRTSTARATSSPSPTSPSAPSTSRTSTAPPAASSDIPQQASPTMQQPTSDSPLVGSSDPDNLGSTSGWLPTVGEHSGVSRVATELRSTAASSSAVLSVNAQATASPDISASTARSRSATIRGATDMPQVDGGGDARPRNESPAAANGKDGTHGMLHQLPSIRFTAHQDPRAPRPSLVFSPLARVLPSGNEVIKVGRYSERDNQPAQIANVPSAAPVGFKSKVVSRRHCEFWYSGGRWFIKDVKSSSGTFLNHIRLSSPGTESKPFPVNDGDIVQLGIDFKGGEEMIFRCVKIKVELNKGWQSAPSSFNVQSHKRLRELNSQGKSPTSSSSQDCSICLGPIAPCQSLFVAPCSHTWHYKCIRVIINGPHWPHFVCPNCRTVADLEAELDDVYADGGWEEVEAADANVGIQASDTPEPANTTRQLRQVSGNRDTNISPQLALEESDQDQMSHSDGDIVEASDDSDIGQRVKDAAEAIDHLNIDEPSFPPSSSTSQFPGVSNATVPPVEIVNKNPVSSLSVGASAHLENPDSRTDRNTIRTPSPNGLPSSMTDVVTSTEGPMTPRNDVGPFVFDGSAGRLSDIRLATVASLDLDTAADTPQQPVPQSSS